jgi:aspartate/methionine/tyrosine aminotransferase
VSNPVSEEFYRIKRLPPYVFAEVNRLKAKYRAEGMDIIDFGMGNPDMDTPRHIVDKLVETVQKPRTHRYSASKGIPGLRRAQAGYYARRFGVKLDPETEVIATLGSKEGLANLAMAITAPGDVMLVPNPSYPIHPYGFMIAGGTLRHVPALHDGRFDPEEYIRALERAVIHSVPKPVAVVVSFPSNPTAQVTDLDFYRDLIAFAKKHHLWVLSDLAYAEIYFDGDPPPSILQVEGARDVAVEFTSLSKTYAMPGWRMGFAVGNTPADRRAHPDQVLSRLRRLHARSRSPPPPRSTAPTTASPRSGRSTRRAATCWSMPWPAPAGRSPRRPPPCSPGRRCPSPSAPSARWASPRSCCARPRSRSPPASASANTARATSASASWRTSTASARPPAA